MPSKRFFDRLTTFFCIGILLMYPMLVFAGSQTHTSCIASQFSGGTFSSTQCVNGQVELTAAGKTNKSGTFVSKTFDATEYTNWNSISWATDSPYDKPLPNNNGNESGWYTTGTVDMTNNRLLLHFEENSGTIYDSSSYNNHSSSTTALTYQATGQFNSALWFNGVNSTINFDDQNEMDYDTGESFSIATWVRTTSTQGYIIQKRPLSEGGENAYWYAAVDGNGKATFVVNDTGNTSASITSATSVNDGNWHHVLFVRDQDTNYLRLYVDGNEDATPVADSSVNLSNGAHLTVGYDSTNFQWPFKGNLDDLAVLSSVASTTDAWAMYRRAIVRLSFAVRTCDDIICIDEPDFSAGSISELSNSSASSPSLSVSVGDNRYFQYKAYFSTDDSSFTPELLSVSVSYASNGVPEFTHVIYIVTILFSMFYLSRYIRERGQV